MFNVLQYFVWEGMVDMFGLELIVGIDFQFGEYCEYQDVVSDLIIEIMGSLVILIKFVVDKLYLDGDVFGKMIYSGCFLLCVIGVVKELGCLIWVNGDMYDLMLLLVCMFYDMGFYLICVIDLV